MAEPSKEVERSISSPALTNSKEINRKSRFPLPIPPKTLHWRPTRGLWFFKIRQRQRRILRILTSVVWLGSHCMNRRITRRGQDSKSLERRIQSLECRITHRGGDSKLRSCENSTRNAFRNSTESATVSSRRPCANSYWSSSITNSTMHHQSLTDTNSRSVLDSAMAQTKFDGDISN